MVMEVDLAWDGERVRQHMDDALQNCTLQTCVVLLTHVTQINVV